MIRLTEYDVKDGKFIVEDGLGKPIGISSSNVEMLAKQNSFEKKMVEPEIENMLSFEQKDISANDEPLENPLQFTNPVEATIPQTMGTFINPNLMDEQPERVEEDTMPVIEANMEMKMPEMQDEIIAKGPAEMTDQLFENIGAPVQNAQTNIAAVESTPTKEEVKSFIDNFDINTFYSETPSQNMNQPVIEPNNEKELNPTSNLNNNTIEKSEQTNSSTEKKEFNEQELRAQLTDIVNNELKQATVKIVDAFIKQIKFSINISEEKNIQEINPTSIDIPSIGDVMNETSIQVDKEIKNFANTL